MALTPPTVASDPASATHTNTALAAVNVFISTAYTEIADAVRVLRRRAEVVGASSMLLVDIDNHLSTLNGGPGSAPTVTANPATQSETNTALAVLTGYIDTLNTRAASVLSLFDQSFLRTGGRSDSRENLRTRGALLVTPSAVTAVTVASDPASQAHMNTALADVVAYIDTVNSEFQTALSTFVDDFRTYPGNPVLMADLDNAIAAFN